MSSIDVRAQLRTLTNFRDVGGLLTEDGRQIRSGLLFRSDSVQDIKAEEAAILVGNLGICNIVDLRLGAEAAKQGRGPLMKHPVSYFNVPLIDVDGPSGPPGRVMLEFYVDHLDNDVNLPMAIETIAFAVRRPTLVHCAGGKDRTGLTLLLVELLCGVTVEGAIADFLATAENMDALRTRLRSWPHYRRNIETLSPEIYRCERSSVIGLVEVLQERYGSAEKWARAKEVSPAAIEELRERLVEPVQPDTAESGSP